MEKAKFKTVIKTEKGYSTVDVSTPVLPKKIYGDSEKIARRVITTYHDRPKNLGVLFSGIKGNSKTLTSLCICINSKLDVIMITEPFTGDDFKVFLEGINREVVVFIDEFEKVYNTIELQNEFLTILDGASGNKKLFLFTSNSKELSPYLINRPNRLYYHYVFGNLPVHTVSEIVSDLLKNKRWEEELMEVIRILGSVSFDVLMNFIDEINRYDESPKSLIKILNIEIENTSFDVILITDGNRNILNINYNPLLRERWFFDYKDTKGNYQYKSFKASDFNSSYWVDDTLVFENLDTKIYFSHRNNNTLSIWDNENM